MKIWFGTGSGFIRFGLGLVNLQRTGTTRCTFGFGSQSFHRFNVPDLYLLYNQKVSKIGSLVLKYLIYTYFVTKT